MKSSTEVISDISKYLDIPPSEFGKMIGLVSDDDATSYYKKWVVGGKSKSRYTWNDFTNDYNFEHVASEDCLFKVEFMKNDHNSGIIQTCIRLNAGTYLVPIELLTKTVELYTFNQKVYDRNTRVLLYNFTPPFSIKVRVYPFRYLIQNLGRSKKFRDLIKITPGVYFRTNQIQMVPSGPLYPMVFLNSTIVYTINCESDVPDRCGRKIIKRITRTPDITGSDLIYELMEMKDPLCKNMIPLIIGMIAHRSRSLSWGRNLFGNTIPSRDIDSIKKDLRKNADKIAQTLADTTTVKWGLGLEREQVIYTHSYLMTGKEILSRYVFPEVVGAKYPDTVLGLIKDKYTYIVRSALSSDYINDNFEILEKEKLPPKKETYNESNYRIKLNEKDVDGTTTDSTVLGTVFEFRNTDPYGKTVGQAIYELKAQQDKYLQYIRKQYPESFIPDTGNEAFVMVFYKKTDEGRMDEKKDSSPILKYDIMTGGSESYHLNITLPYKGYDYIKFRRQHIYAMTTLQWFENLLVASYGCPDAFSVGDEGALTEGSSRIISSELVGLANLKLDTIKLHNYQDVINSMAERSISMYRLNIRHKIYSDPKFARTYGTVKKAETSGKFSKRPSERFWSKGTDFRIDVNKEKIAEGKYFGFEFRVLDAIPIDRMTDVLRIIFLICDHSYTLYKNKEIVMSPGDNEKWSNLTFKILKNGFKATVTIEEQKEYIDSLHMGDFITVIPGTTWAHHFFTHLIKGLYSKYGSKGKYSNLVCRDIEGKRYPSIPETQPCLNALHLFDVIDQLYTDPTTGEYRGILKDIYDLIPKGTILLEDLELKIRIKYPTYSSEVLNIVYYLVYHKKLSVIGEDKAGNIVSIKRHR